MTVTVNVQSRTVVLNGTGSRGQAATITIGDVDTGLPGSAVIVTNSGTSAEAVLNFTIPAGVSGGQLFTFSNLTADGDPGPGGVRENNANPALTNKLFFDLSNADGVDVQAWLMTLGLGGTTTRTQLLLRDIGSEAFQIYDVIGDAELATGYVKIPVAYVDGGDQFTNNAVLSVWTSFSPSTLAELSTVITNAINATAAANAATAAAIVATENAEDATDASIAQTALAQTATDNAQDAADLANAAAAAVTTALEDVLGVEFVTYTGSRVLQASDNLKLLAMNGGPGQIHVYVDAGLPADFIAEFIKMGTGNVVLVPGIGGTVAGPGGFNALTTQYKTMKGRMLVPNQLVLTDAEAQVNVPFINRPLFDRPNASGFAAVLFA